MRVRVCVCLDGVSFPIFFSVLSYMFICIYLYVYLYTFIYIFVYMYKHLSRKRGSLMSGANSVVRCSPPKLLFCVACVCILDTCIFMCIVDLDCTDPRFSTGKCCMACPLAVLVGMRCTLRIAGGCSMQHVCVCVFVHVVFV